MAALDFPDSPTVGQVFDKWTWNGTMWVLTPGVAAGYVYVQETAPVPRKVGDTWFDTSTGATGGTSWVAIEEGAVGSEKVWVQTSPGAGLGASRPLAYGTEYTMGPSTANGVVVDLGTLLQPASTTGRALITIQSALYAVNVSMGFSLHFRATGRTPIPGYGFNALSLSMAAFGANVWVTGPSASIATPITVGVKPALTVQINVGSPGSGWHLSHAIDVIEIPG